MQDGSFWSFKTLCDVTRFVVAGRIMNHAAIHRNWCLVPPKPTSANSTAQCTSFRKANISGWSMYSCIFWEICKDAFSVQDFPQRYRILNTYWWSTSWWHRFFLATGGSACCHIRHQQRHCPRGAKKTSESQIWAVWYLHFEIRKLENTKWNPEMVLTVLQERVQGETRFKNCVQDWEEIQKQPIFYIKNMRDVVIPRAQERKELSLSSLLDKIPTGLFWRVWTDSFRV